MTRLGWFECLVLVAFFMAALAAFLIDASRGSGYPLFGHVVQAFLVVVGGWVLRQLYLDLKDQILEKIRKDQAFAQWRQNSHLKGME